MLKIGLTGNMGSGKSTVAKVFETFDIPVFYSDPQARDLYKKSSVKKAVIKRFGEKVSTVRGDINLNVLAEIIFNDKEALTYINDLIHPLVREQFLRWCEKHKNKPYVIQESALIYETGLNTTFDAVILVYAPTKLLIDRIIDRDSISKEDAIKRLALQMPQEEKIKKADYLILNDNSQLVIPSLWNIHLKLSNQIETA